MQTASHQNKKYTMYTAHPHDMVHVTAEFQENTLILLRVTEWQTWGQIQKYLYLKVFKYFFFKYLYLYLYLSFPKWKVVVFVFKYIQKVFDISNTIQIHFKHFYNLFLYHIYPAQPSSSCLLYFMAFYCLLI